MSWVNVNYERIIGGNRTIGTKKKKKAPQRNYSTFLLLNVFFMGGCSILTWWGLPIGDMETSVQIRLYALLLFYIATFISSIGMWRWKRWGYYGSLISISLLGLFMIIGGLLPVGIFLLGWLGIVYFVTRPVKAHFR